MATERRVKEKEPLDIVHQNAIHVETILKEQRCQKLYTEFTINPFRKCESIAVVVVDGFIKDK